MNGSSTPSTPKLTALSEASEDGVGEGQGHRAETESPNGTAGDTEHLQDAPPIVGASPGTGISVLPCLLSSHHSPRWRPRSRMSHSQR